ncbi:MAG: hypothetical protein Q9182_003876, partial [Xanthomendoza sp. 2 TL-2023]
MDAFSFAASVTTLIEAASEVITYIVNVKRAPKELLDLKVEIQGLRTELEEFSQLSNQREGDEHPGQILWLPTFSQFANLDNEASPLAGCHKELKALSEKLRPPKWARVDSRRSAAAQALTWPFKEQETSRSLRKIRNLRDSLTSGLNIDHVNLSLETRKDVQGLRKQTCSIEQKLLLVRITKWLSVPDPSVNYNEARQRRQASTGKWFTNDSKYAAWKTEPNSIMWLHGIPGCGKTILSSTIIQDLLNLRQHYDSYAVAYFYFDANRADTQSPSKMIRSLLLQISGQGAATFQVLERMYWSSQEGSDHRQPTAESVLHCLREATWNLSAVYLVIDALDECTSRSELLRLLRQINAWSLAQVHMLLTSQRVGDITEVLESFIPHRSIMTIQGPGVDEDIRTYVRSQFQYGALLERWHEQREIREEIEMRLMAKADGMFLWVACQIDELQDCLTKSMIRETLDSLPSTLNETYARLLGNIKKLHQNLARKLLQWLVYSLEPLHFGELVDILAVDLDRLPRFDPERRIPNPEALLKICSSLITIGTDSGEGEKIVKLAHLSVREYLTSIDILAGDRAVYAVESLRAHETIAEDCLAYLIHTASENVFRYDGVDHHSFGNYVKKFEADFPFISYAEHHWMHHARIVKEEPEQLFSLIAKFFESDIFNHQFCPSRYRLASLSRQPLEHVRLIAATSHGLPRLVQHLLKQGIDHSYMGEPAHNRDIEITNRFVDVADRVYGDSVVLLRSPAEGSFEAIEAPLNAGKSEIVPTEDSRIVTKAFI